MTGRVLLLAVALTVSGGQNAFDHISQESLRASLTYLASDELEGRGTPSHGLDLAADYIARQFQREGLQPAASDGSYFQTARFNRITTRLNGFGLTLKSEGKDLEITADEVRVRSLVALDLEDAPVLRLPDAGRVPPIEGLVVAAPLDRYRTQSSIEAIEAGKPALILLLARGTRPSGPSQPYLEDAETPHTPIIHIHEPAAAALVRANRPFTLSVHLPQPAIERATLRNVAAVLPGSDPALRDQYVVLSAHYDHLGKTDRGIFNGANDNGSGTVSVIAIAGGLVQLAPHPKRSILFLAFFGEEEGLLGSTYYVQHPLVPLDHTIADVNLEQLGRTDEKTGAKLGAFAMTGPSTSNLSAIIASAAQTEGVKVWKRSDADAFFSRSDNYAFAEHGVVDTTVAVAFEYPDYHAIGDTVDKIDFANMVRIDRALAAAIERLADEAGVPKWFHRPKGEN